MKYGAAAKISQQKSSITNKDTGEIYEFQNRKFVEWIRNSANKEAHAYCKQKVKESLVIEQDPDKRFEPDDQPRGVVYPQEYPIPVQFPSEQEDQEQPTNQLNLLHYFF